MIFAGYEALFFQTRAPVVGVMAGVGMCEIGIAADSVFDLQAHGPGMVVVRHKGHDQQQEQGPAQKGYGGLSFHAIGGLSGKDRNYSSIRGGWFAETPPRASAVVQRES